MTLQGIDPGDIVQVDIKGRRFFAIVKDREAGEVRLTPLSPGITYFTAKPRQIIGLYRKAKGSA